MASADIVKSLYATREDTSNEWHRSTDEVDAYLREHLNRIYQSYLAVLCF